MGGKPDVRVRRVDEPEPEDGTGAGRPHLAARADQGQARLDQWFKQVAPSTGCTWYSHDPERFEEFGRRYRESSRMPSAPQRWSSCGSWPGAGR